MEVPPRWMPGFLRQTLGINPSYQLHQGTNLGSTKPTIKKQVLHATYRKDGMGHCQVLYKLYPNNHWATNQGTHESQDLRQDTWGTLEGSLF